MPRPASPLAVERGARSPVPAPDDAPFHALLDELLRLHPQLAEAGLAEGRPFQLGQQLVGLAPGGALAPGRLIVHLDLDHAVAVLPARAVPALHAALLRANHDGCLQGRGYAISPDTGRLLYVDSLPLHGLDAAQLVVRLDLLCRQLGQFIHVLVERTLS